ncbi:MAG: 2-succinyl-5-enolpyruvyl-6-hydroxy-3-cyclohexene-1-carboxylic-acid synthase [Muribaculaceae bacterium]|nr:2-succinyl-5-enolpyruvyl-6-hydroxy-3-cyclohexene-1-carboxylic-acid synthase [Muribaculaceae bacterium]
MTTTDKFTCRQLAHLLQAYGVKKAVLSPGTRDTPIIMALNRSENITCSVVIDERSAAFTALGMATVSGEPVAIVCTSGTAPLNFAPAIAEAFYRNIPLIVVTADRPAQWIDQDDSQTIHQPGIYTNYIKKQYTLPDNPADKELRWMVNRCLNEGLQAAVSSPAGPVHFNIEIGEPISSQAEVDETEDVRVISLISPEPDMSTSASRALGRELAPQKVLIVGGFHRPDSRLSRAISRLAAIPNIAVITEATANIRPAHSIVTAVDPTLLCADKEQLHPDVVISFGGSIVSRNLKETIRQWNVPHWYVGRSEHLTDCFMGLSRVFDMDAPLFFARMASAMQPFAASKSIYRDQWLATQAKALDLTNNFDAQWSDMAAVSQVARKLPRQCNLSVSNGMTLRHLLATPPDVHRLDCNRGVSGIDGSTSTAIGASAVYPDTTIFITGDMSAQYDMGALASALVSPRFKMIVVNNGEGNIFRIIKTTRSLPELDRYMAAHVNLPLKEIGTAYGFKVFEASSTEELDRTFGRFIAEKDKPAILILKTDPEQSAAEYRRYIRHLRTNTVN